jgi:hypothetical protein
MRRVPKDHFAPIYEEFDFSSQRTRGSVAVKFHTYHGVLVFAIQTPHAGYVPVEEAREFLWRLHRFNLTWGLFAYGALVIPFLSYFNYRSQLKSIGRQEAELDRARARRQSGPREPTRSMMRELLEEVRTNLGTPPRSLGFFNRRRLRVRPPKWMRRRDELREIYRDQAQLLEEGTVVWGATVQANNALFSPGEGDSPAMVVYAADQTFDQSPERLIEIATRMFQLKDTTPEDPRERRVAELVSDEMGRQMGWLLPKHFADGRKVYAATYMVFRQHLPDGYLESRWLPLLIHPDTDSVMIVPSVYWPDALVGLWSKDDE